MLWPTLTLALVPALASPAIVPHESFNLKFVAPASATAPEDAPVLDLVPQERGAAHNWFAAQFSDLPLGPIPNFRIHMAGQNTTNPADVNKWRGLKPVYTYADPDQLATYEVFRRDSRGTWHCVLSPLRNGQASEAGNAGLPRQSAINANFAPLFLSADKQSWSAWRTISDTQIDSENNIFSFRQNFLAPGATVAMRVPFTNEFYDRFCAQLSAADEPGVSVDEVGTTPAGRTLRVLRLEDAADTIPANTRPTIAVFAREHSTEHDGSWAVYGLLARLLDGSPESNKLRAAATWLLVPLQDPDGAALSQFERMTEKFQKPHDPKIPPEVFAWTRYFADWVNRGRTLDVAISIHNVESEEQPNLSSPFVNQAHGDLIESFNQQMFADVKTAGFSVGGTQGITEGASPFRLYGWCARQLGALDLAYEVNGRYPAQRLDQAQIGEIGATMGDSLARWLWSPPGQDWRGQSARFVKLRAEKRQLYIAEKGALAPANTERANYELLELGF